MKLTYRGVRYDYTPRLIPRQVEIFRTGVYRGNPVSFQPALTNGKAVEADLTWRGISYHRGNDAETARPVAGSTASQPPINEPIEAQPQPSIAAEARDLFIRHHQRSRKREQAMLIRLAAEVGVPIEAVVLYESQIQGKLPHDFAGYDRSKAAMS